MVHYAHVGIPIDLSGLHQKILTYCGRVKAVTSEMSRFKHFASYKAQGLSSVGINLGQASVKQCLLIEKQLNDIEHIWLTPVTGITNIESNRHSSYLENLFDQMNDAPEPIVWDYDTEPELKINRSINFVMNQRPPTPETRTRVKRQLLLGAGAVILSAISAFSNIYTQVNLEDLSSQMHRQNQYNLKVLKEVANRVNLNSEAVEMLNKTTHGLLKKIQQSNSDSEYFASGSRSYMAMNTLTIETQRIFLGLESLSRHRLSPFLVDPKEVGTTLDELKASMSHHGFKLAIDSVYQIFSLEASHVYFLNRTLNVFVHIPCYRQEDMLSLYRFRSAPIRLPLVEGSTYIEPDLEMEYLAISDTETKFQTFTPYRLSLCESIFGIHVCPDNNVIDKRTSKDCLVALFQNRIHQIKKLCPWKESKIDKAIQLNDTSFLLFVAPPRVDNAVLKCNGDEHVVNERIKITGSQVISLKPRCDLYSENYVLSSVEQFVTTTPLITFRELELDHMFAYLNLTGDDHSIIDVLQQIRLSEPLTISNWEEEVRSRSTHGKWIVGGLSTMALVIAICSFLFCIYLKKIKSWFRTGRFVEDNEYKQRRLNNQRMNQHRESVREAENLRNDYYQNLRRVSPSLDLVEEERFNDIELKQVAEAEVEIPDPELNPESVRTVVFRNQGHSRQPSDSMRTFPSSSPSKPPRTSLVNKQ